MKGMKVVVRETTGDREDLYFFNSRIEHAYHTRSTAFSVCKDTVWFKEKL
jgi:hypothetical protein